MPLLQYRAQGYPNELLVPCTKSSDVSCQLLQHRAAINKVLLEVGLDIRADHRQNGGVRMAVSSTPVCNNFFCWEPKEWLETSSMNLVHDLIANHRCFSALEMYSTTPWPKRVHRALKRGSAVKSLTVYLVLRRGYHATFHEGAFALVSSLTSLEELAFKGARDPYFSVIEPVCGRLLDESLRHMTTLDVINVQLEPKNTLAFFWALTDIRGVTDFAVNWSMLRDGLTGPAKLGSLRLLRRLAVLRKLTLTGRQDDEDLALWLRLTERFAEVAKLEELYVKMEMAVEIYTTVCEGFAQVVLRCTELRRLQLPTSSRTRSSLLPEYDDTRWPESLIDALKATRELRDLYISIAGMGETQLCSLFAAVQDNRTLRNVVIWDGLCTYDRCLNVQLFSWLSRKGTLGHSVSFGQELLVDYESSLYLVELPELRSLKFFRLKFRLQFQFTGKFLACCKILCRRSSRTIFEVCCIAASEPTFEHWLTWLAESSALTHVTVVADCHGCAYCADVCNRVVTALARNSSIAKLRLVKFQLETAHLDALCQNAHEHRSLGEFVLTPGCWAFHTVCSRNCNRFSEGFRLALLQLQDVVRHNASRMSAAVQFVLGGETAEGASAIEELRDHPLLPESVRVDSGMTDAEALENVRLAVSSVLYCDVHYFLWLTGVVRERRATRLDHNAQRLHILDLPLVGWYCIRQYLKVTDVASG